MNRSRVFFVAICKLFLCLLGIVLWFVRLLVVFFSRAILDPIIRLTNVTVFRGAKLVLPHFNWTTRRGEHWFIMGANGSGKTTLMDVLMGYLWPRDGKVEVLGREFGRTSLPELRKLVGCVSPWIFKRMAPEISVEDVVASGFDASLGFFRRKTPLVKQAVRRWLGFFGCRGLESRLFGELSSGQQLKVILARALVHDPALVILDEPFSLLDIGSRVRIYHYIEKIARRKSSPQFILVTHHREDILPVFGHGMILKEGALESIGSRQEVLAPANLARAFDIDRATARRYFV